MLSLGPQSDLAVLVEIRRHPRQAGDVEAGVLKDKTPGSAKTGSARLSAISRNPQDRGRTVWANLDVIGFGQRGVSFIRPIPSAWLQDP